MVPWRGEQAEGEQRSRLKSRVRQRAENFVAQWQERGSVYIRNLVMLWGAAAVRIKGCECCAEVR